MPVSASKLVTLAQLQAQAERVKQELAKYTLASELGSLAKKSEISEADLSAALKSVIDGKMDAADSMTTEAINSAIATAIAKSAHARFEKVEKVPSNDEAQDNVLYLVMNAATGYYDIYAKVGEEVVRLDDTTVDLSNYATIEQLNAVSGGIGGTVYARRKTCLHPMIRLSPRISRRTPMWPSRRAMSSWSRPPLATLPTRSPPTSTTARRGWR